MLNNNLFIFILTISVCFSAKSQFGYQNKKNIFSAHVMFNSPLLSGAYSQIQYREKAGEMVGRKERLNFGYTLLYIHQLNRGFGFGAEMTMKQSYVASPLFYYTSSDNTLDSSYLRMEALDIRSFSYQVRLDFSNKKGIAPAGIVHGIGFGYTESRLKNKDYKYSINEFGINELQKEFWTEIDNYYVYQGYPKVRATTISYDMTYRHPITSKLTFDIGIKYLICVYFQNEIDKNSELKGQPIDFTQAYIDMKRENFVTISLKTGLSFIF
jgi:hypothetical protein